MRAVDMKALTIRQPWAQAIADGHKPLENRTWRPRSLPLGSPLAIHAGLAFEDTAVGQIADLAGVTYDRTTAPGGVIVAVARLEGLVEESPSPWFCGPIGWRLGAVQAVSPPVPCKGGQGLWDVPRDVLAQLPLRTPAGRVVNVASGEPFDVYIGRRNGGIFGNPIRLGHPCMLCGQTHTRATTLGLECYEQHLRRQLRVDPDFAVRVRRLFGLRLGCHCAPLPCHGDVLARVAAELAAPSAAIEPQPDAPMGCGHDLARTYIVREDESRQCGRCFRGEQ